MFAWSALGLVVTVSAGCNVINRPQTVTVGARDPLWPDRQSATVVVQRSSLRDRPPLCRGFAGDPSFVTTCMDYIDPVRILDSRGEPVLDLEPGQHGVIRLPAGEQLLFAVSWRYGEHPLCVGVLDASLDAGKLYAVRVTTGPMVPGRGCARLGLERVRNEERDAFQDELRSSKRLVFLGERRDRNVWLDDDRRVRATVARGKLRMAEDREWHPSNSMLTSEDALRPLAAH